MPPGVCALSPDNTIGWLALQAQLGKNLRKASTVTKTSHMSRDRCIWKNNGLCTMGSHVRMVVPPSFAAP